MNYTYKPALFITWCQFGNYPGQTFIYIESIYTGISTRPINRSYYLYDIRYLLKYRYSALVSGPASY